MKPAKSLLNCAAAFVGVAATLVSAATQGAHAQTNASTPPAQSATAPSAPAALSAPKVWTPAPALLSQLASAPVQFGRYGMRPPLGYKEVERSSPDGAGKVYFWSQSAAPSISGSAPNISVVEATVPKDNSAAQYTPEQIMQNLLDGLHTNYSINWHVTFVEHGTINGLSFAHQTWSGSATGTGPVVHGSLYGTVRPNGAFVLVMAEDSEPDSRATLPILDSAIATLSIK